MSTQDEFDVNAAEKAWNSPAPPAISATEEPTLTHWAMGFDLDRRPRPKMAASVSPAKNKQS